MRTKLGALAAVVALAGAFGFALLGPAAVSAAPGGGAQQSGDQINVHDCQDDGTVTICFDAKGEYHSVCTASGGCNYQENFKSECFTVTDDATGTVLLQDCESNIHQQLHVDKGGDVQVVAVHATGTFSDGTTTCTFTAVFHAANGQIQYDRSTSSCI